MLSLCIESDELVLATPLLKGFQDVEDDLLKWFSFKKGRKSMFDFYLHYGLDIGRISNG